MSVVWSHISRSFSTLATHFWKCRCSLRNAKKKKMFKCLSRHVGARLRESGLVGTVKAVALRASATGLGAATFDIAPTSTLLSLFLNCRAVWSLRLRLSSRSRKTPAVRSGRMRWRPCTLGVSRFPLTLHRRDVFLSFLPQNTCVDPSVGSRTVPRRKCQLLRRHSLSGKIASGNGITKQAGTVDASFGLDARYGTATPTSVQPFRRTPTLTRWAVILRRGKITNTTATVSLACRYHPLSPKTRFSILFYININCVHKILQIPSHLLPATILRLGRHGSISLGKRKSFLARGARLWPNGTDRKAASK